MNASAAYFHFVAAIAVHLFNLMESIDEYEAEMEELRNAMSEWLGKEWEFVTNEFGDCNLVKAAMAKSILSFCGELSSEQQAEIDKFEANKQEGVKLAAVDDNLRKNVVNYYSHIHLAKK